MGSLPDEHGARDPFLGMHAVNVYVRDQERSLRFYLETLGFQVAFDVRVESGQRLVAVAPPDGTTVLTLIQPPPAAAERSASDNHATAWGGAFARFEDVDRNSFALVSFDEVSRAVEAQRQAAAERREAERRAAQELEIARQVQARLFPQRLPELESLEYAGACVQTHQVGGDYYDFLDLGQARLGLVLGDIAGKGIAAALLMANLQANLRSQCATAVEQPEQLLRSVNRLFYENTAENAYATLFYSEFDDRTCRLRYANCGHLPGLVVRSEGTVTRLSSTATVLGLFTEWPCHTEELQLCPGDVFAIYTDGITEAVNQRDEEFGEERLLDVMRCARDLSPRHIVTAVFEEVRRFSGDQQHDDVTLIVARCRSRETERLQPGT
ncbi:MAG TPA: SpoIIE family protein phosphatase [Vicinamibacterales bacterium]|nr:SpoIIE family protein phosphatase [Vicinamibacterales bacterium]